VPRHLLTTGRSCGQRWPLRSCRFNSAAFSSISGKRLIWASMTRRLRTVCRALGWPLAVDCSAGFRSLDKVIAVLYALSRVIIRIGNPGQI
jgi:hypothetical protein